MCGIAGIWHAGDTSILSLMLDRLVHRGPDTKGIYENHESNLFLGHRRLRIIDLSPQADQPMTSSDGRFVITYNGEVYNFREIRKKLEKLGLRFKTKSDTEVVLSALITWGTGCLKEFEGMFAFALWDNEKRKLTLARDRFGVKPLYFWQKGNSLIFASELKAILEHPTINRELNLSALADFLELGYIPEPKSIIKGVHKVPAGSILEFCENNAEPKIKR
ncbi:MAG TPA: asparagine synthetase B, partial [candidate division Zixibacteria bacterium]|nr:asparagine synthetase B [candidate division Zixibacteria bacterium]